MTAEEAMKRLININKDMDPDGCGWDYAYEMSDIIEQYEEANNGN